MEARGFGVEVGLSTRPREFMVILTLE